MRNSTRQIDLDSAETAAIGAAREVGALLRRNFLKPKSANAVTQHDIKLELDVRSQKLIEKRLRRAFPDAAVLGEEGTVGDPQSDYRWVVDPIDGTVNFAYQIPHSCVSIALQGKTGGPMAYEDGFESLVGVVYDPFCDELWTAIRGGPARLNGRLARVSPRTRLAQAVVSIGFAKTRADLETTMPYFTALIHRVRKLRIMGSAALALTYVASGRFDAYIERGIHLWDIAAGGLILESAGGKFWREPIPGNYAYRMIASNKLLHSRFGPLPRF